MKTKRARIVEVRVWFTCRIIQLHRGNGLVEEGEPLCRVESLFPWVREDIKSPAPGYLRWVEGIEKMAEKPLEERPWLEPGELIATIKPPVQI
jgi:hypothetical protein